MCVSAVDTSMYTKNDFVFSGREWRRTRQIVAYLRPSFEGAWRSGRRPLGVRVNKFLTLIDHLFWSHVDSIDDVVLAHACCSCYRRRTLPALHGRGAGVRMLRRIGDEFKMAGPISAEEVSFDSGRLTAPVVQKSQESRQ